MFQAKSRMLDQDRTRQVRLYQKNRILSRNAVLDLWEHDPEFCDFFRVTLNHADLTAYFWELPAWTSSNLDDDFEFVQIASPALAKTSANARAFQAYFQDHGSEVVTFPNLGRDALLVVPCPLGPAQNYAHLATFVKHAESQQCRELFRQLALAMRERLNHGTVWLSTSGLGVPWLHIRLDSRPKYVVHVPYRRIPTPS